MPGETHINDNTAYSLPLPALDDMMMTKSGILGHPLHGPPKELGGFRPFADILQEVVIGPERYVKASASWVLELGVFAHGVDNAPTRLVHILGHEANDVQVERVL